MGNTSTTPQFEIVDAPEFEVVDAKTPAERRFENEVARKAVQSVPKPAFFGQEPKSVPSVPEDPFLEEEGGFRPKPKPLQLTPYSFPHALLGGPLDVLTSGGMPGNVSEPPTGGEFTSGLERMRKPGQRTAGALQAAGALAEATAPVMGPAIFENPLPMARGLVEATLASKATEAATRAAGASPEVQQRASNLAWLLPMVTRAAIQPQVGVETTPEGTRVAATAAGGRAGAGVAVTPEGVSLRGKLGPFEASKTFARGTPSVRPGIEPPTIEGAPAAPPDPAAEMILQHDRMMRGEPPIEPPPAPSTPQPMPEINAEKLGAIGKEIAALPGERRAQAIIQAHEELSKALLQQGKIVTPDGKLEIVKNQDQADRLAQQIINDEVVRQDKLAAAPAKETPTTPGPVTPTGVRKTRKAQAEELAKPQFEVAEAPKAKPAPQFEIAEPTIQSSAQETPSAPRQSAAATETPAPTQEAKEPEKAAVAGPEAKTGFEKESPVSFTRNYQLAKGEGKSEIIRAGTKAFVEYVQPNMNVVRVRLADGRKLSVNSRYLQAGVQSAHAESTEGNLPQSNALPLERPGRAEGGGQPEPSAQPSLTRGTEGAPSELHGNAGEEPVRVGQRTGAPVAGKPADILSGSEAAAAVEKPTKYKFGNTQAPIPADSEAATALNTARERIPDADLMGKGKDIGAGGNHVTVRYGIKGEDTEGIKKFLSDQEPFEATLGKTEKFPPSEHSDGAAVIIAPIEADELHRLNSEIEKHAEFTEPSFAEYKPHATIAYVDPEKAGRYVGMKVTEGKKFKIDQIAIADKNGKQEIVKLEGKKTAKAPQPSNLPTPESHAASQAAFDKNYPPGAVSKGLTGDALRAWQESIDNPLPKEEDIGSKVRAKNPEPTRAEVKAAPPAPGKVGEMKISDLKVAPSRFQYKAATDAEGVGTLLKETKVFNPELAGIISVWTDPADGNTYVVNGHHRFELAKRTGPETVTVRHIVAKDATEARAIGALQNIAEGRGTAVDAAKFFRDTGLAPEDLKAKGVSLGEATAREGLALSRLEPSVFQKVVSGELRQGRATTIGEATADHAEQKAILSLIDRKERSGTKVSDETLSELIRLVKGSEQRTETTANLFGTQEINRSLALEKAEISAYIKQQLSRDKKLFGFVAKENRATELARAGNKINIAESGRISSEAAQAEEVYNKLLERGRPISGILDESARKLADGEPPAAVKSDAYGQVRAEVSKTLGRPEGTGAQRPAGAPETAEAGKPEGAIDLFSGAFPQGQPLFNSYFPSFPPAVAKDITFSEVPTKEGVPPYLKVNGAAIQAISRSLGVDFLGVNLDKPSVTKVSNALRTAADTAEMNGGPNADNATRQLRGLADALDSILDRDPEHGVSIVREGETAQTLATAHEELLHAAQRKAGKGDIAAGVPWWNALRDPVISGLAADLSEQFAHAGIEASAPALVAEAMVDLLRGDATHLSPEGATQAAEHYFETAAQQHGIEHLKDLQAVQDYIAGQEEALNVTHSPEVLAIRRAGEEALARTIARRSGEQVRGTGTALQGQPVQQPQGATSASGATNLGPSDNTGARREGPPAAAEKPLFSTQPVGLSDEELEDWSRSKGFRSEPAGEQLGIFGKNDPLLRVFRQGPRGREQRGLVYQSQLDSLKKSQAEAPAEPFALSATNAPTEEQPRLFGAGDLGEIIGNPKAPQPTLPAKQQEGGLFGSERGSTSTAGIVEAPVAAAKAVAAAAGTVKDFLKSAAEANRHAREMQWKMYDLEKMRTGFALEMKNLLQQLKQDGVTQEDSRAIYEHRDALQADSDHVPIPQLTDRQDEVLDDVILPLREQTDAIHRKVEQGGWEIPNYNPRQVKGKGSFLDRIQQKYEQGKGERGGAPLSTYNPASEHRVMMALENGDKRLVVSLKNGQVTAWRSGKPENLGPIVQTEDGREFRDKDGNIWKLKQATTAEIQKHTDLRYHQDAVATEAAAWVKAKSIEAAYDFVERVKNSDDFKSFAVKAENADGAPKGWRTTAIPQFKGYYFDPVHSEALDWFYDRIRGGDVGMLGQLNDFIRVNVLLNPVKHTLNISAQWLYQRGVSGFLPNRLYTGFRTGRRAMGAVLNQNQDLIEAYKAGFPGQAASEATRDLVTAFYERLADGAEKGEPWATRISNAVGYSPLRLAKAVHSAVSEKLVWPVCDALFLQSAYQYQAEHPGVGLNQAFREVGKYIPEYRVPVRVGLPTKPGSAISTLFFEPTWTVNGKKVPNLLSWFGAYHYGELRSIKEGLTGAVGASEKAAGEGRAETVARSWDRLIMLAIGSLLLGTAGAALLRKATGDKDAHILAPGVFGLVQVAYDLAAGETTAPRAAQKVITPNPLTVGGGQLLFNREFRTGRNILSPGAAASDQSSELVDYLLRTVLPETEQIEQANRHREGWKKLLWNQADVSFAHRGARHLADEIASSKMDTSAWTKDEREQYYARQRALEGLRKGDSSALSEALSQGSLKPGEMSRLLRRSMHTELQDKMHDFSYAETRRVYDKAVADGDEEAQKEILPILFEKQLNAFSAGQSAVQ